MVDNFLRCLVKVIVFEGVLVVVDRHLTDVISQRFEVELQTNHVVAQEEALVLYQITGEEQLSFIGHLKHFFVPMEGIQLLWDPRNRRRLPVNRCPPNFLVRRFANLVAKGLSNLLGTVAGTENRLVLGQQLFD